MQIYNNGSNIFTQSFITKLAIENARNEVQDFEGRSLPDDEFSFDAYRLAGFEDAFGSDRRYIRPSDRGFVFDLILGE